jgi:cytochrome c biogenesis protein CcdA
MLALLLLVASIAIADSLNPSTIGPSVLLATGPRPRVAVAGFTLGVFTVSLVGGLVLTFGPGQLLLSLVPHPDRDTRRLIELVGGIALVVLAAALWLGARLAGHRLAELQPRGRSAFLAGAGIMAVELPTALPYFAAIAAIVGSGVSMVAQAVLVLVFNVLFVAPLLAILGFLTVAGDRSTRQLRRFGGWLIRRAPQLLAVLLGVGGLVLVAIGGVGLATRG